MANQEQLAILKKGVNFWYGWREKNPEIKIDFKGANLAGTDLSIFNLTGANLSNANLANANLRATNLSDANLIGADLSHALLEDADLTRANLSDANLIGADFNEAHLPYAILDRTTLIDTDFTGAYLYRTSLKRATLVRTNLSEADLSNADLSGATLNLAYFREARLDFTNLSKVELGDTTFAKIDFSNTYGLEDIVHLFPSSIGIDSIQFSKGSMPEKFLRGCGLSDLDIQYARLASPSLSPEQVTEITYRIHQLYVGGGIQYYSCFISYSSKDEEFAQKLHDDLQNNGVRCWFDREDLKIGDAIRPTIDRQIRLRDKLLVILSENSIKSEWVGDEVEGALEEEQKGNRSVLFPIRLDDTILNTRDDWAAKIKRRRHIGDFSNWKDKGSYQKAFERLLRDLKAPSEIKDELE
jgi:uncharacterized protein YjbI with pentapeptide repeats